MFTSRSSATALTYGSWIEHEQWRQWCSIHDPYVSAVAAALPSPPRPRRRPRRRQAPGRAQRTRARLHISCGCPCCSVHCPANNGYCPGAIPAAAAAAAVDSLATVASRAAAGATIMPRSQRHRRLEHEFLPRLQPKLLTISRALKMCTENRPCLCGGSLCAGYSVATCPVSCKRHL